MDLVRYPDPGLVQATLHVSEQIPSSVVRDMFRVMYKHRGIGLASTQAGLNIRFFVSNIEGDQKQKDRELVAVNPEIIDKAGVVTEDEACLSLPGIHAKITRARKVVVRYTDLSGKEIVLEAEGLAARMFQHETDHLDGILILDRMTPADRRAAAPELKSLERIHHEKKRLAADRES